MENVVRKKTKQKKSKQQRRGCHRQTEGVQKPLREQEEILILLSLKYFLQHFFPIEIFRENGKKWRCYLKTC